MEDILTKIDFDEQCDRLVTYFRFNGMTKEQAFMMYDRLKTYPIKAITYAVDNIVETRRPTPSNFPTVREIMEQCWQWLDNHPEEKFRRKLPYFDPIEDPEYPINKLWDGFNILMKSGMDEFEKFANENRMPRNDRDRVKMKARIVKAKKEEKGNKIIEEMLGKITIDAN